MKTRIMWLVVAVTAILALAAGGAGALPGSLEPEDVVGSKIHYQGRLTDPGGAPLTGTFPMRFQIWNAAQGGVSLWDSGAMNVDVDHGLFNVELEPYHSLFDGQALWLRIQVDGEWLTPRQELAPVPYALSLRPGATITGETWNGWGLTVNWPNPLATGGAVYGSSATSTAIMGRSEGGYGLIGYSDDNYGVYGFGGNNTQGNGYGGYFLSNTGVGLYGESKADSHYTNMYAPGVYGRSANGVGVYGLSDASSWPGYGGYFEGGVGLHARGTGSAAEYGYAASFISEKYRGIYARSLSGHYDAYFDGFAGIYSNGGYTNLAANQQVVVNGGDEALEPGDVVAIAGIATAPSGEPLLAVRKADGTNAQAVVGVVAQALRVEAGGVTGSQGVQSPGVQVAEGNIPPQGYLTIITSGLAPAVKVSASAGDLGIGDLLTVSSTAGASRKAQAADGGTILGKVVGPVDPKTGTVPVFVALH